jgi:hypothetical protein
LLLLLLFLLSRCNQNIPKLIENNIDGS